MTKIQLNEKTIVEKKKLEVVVTPEFVSLFKTTNVVSRTINRYNQICR